MRECIGERQDGPGSSHALMALPTMRSGVISAVQ
jgi:hypothetical protein